MPEGDNPPTRFWCKGFPKSGAAMANAVTSPRIVPPTSRELGGRGRSARGARRDLRQPESVIVAVGLAAVLVILDAGRHPGDEVRRAEPEVRRVPDEARLD